MTKKLILFTFILMALISPGMSQVREVPASADVYVDINGGQVINSDILRCATVTESLAHSERKVDNLIAELSKVPCTESESGFMNTSIAEGNASYPSAAMVQFDLSGISFADDDVGILVMRAQRVEKIDEGQSAIVGIIPVASYWGENTSFLGIMSNWIQLLQVIEDGGVKGLMQRMAINTANDRTFAFDVSKNIKESKDGKVSFVIMVLSDGSYTVDFASRENAEGSCLIIMPYPRGRSLAIIPAVSPMVSTAMPKTSIEDGEAFSSALSPERTPSVITLPHGDEAKTRAEGCNATSSKATLRNIPPMIRRRS